jgi:hypothetical protein
LYKRACAVLFGAMMLPVPASAQENPAARRAPGDVLKLAGYWNGANLENRSHCNASQNNGSHGTYAQYLVTFDPPASTMGIDESAVTGLSCTYVGPYGGDRFAPSWSGSYSCSDGKRGTFQSTFFLITPTEMQIRLAIKLTGAETCDVDAILGGSRF